MNATVFVPSTRPGIPAANLPNSFAVDRSQIFLSGPVIKSSILCFLPFSSKMWFATRFGCKICSGPTGDQIFGNGECGMMRGRYGISTLGSA